MVEVGVIHGRFQVFHNDHLEYVLAGKSRCRHIVVGNPRRIIGISQKIAHGGFGGRQWAFHGIPAVLQWFFDKSATKEPNSLFGHRG